jgi:hypothetical protein
VSKLTQVELLWLDKRIANGSVAAEPRNSKSSTATARRIVRNRQYLRLPPLDLERYGTVLSRIDILHAVERAGATRPCPTCRLEGRFCRALVEKVLQTIDGIDALGIDPRRRRSR